MVLGGERAGMAGVSSQLGTPSERHFTTLLTQSDRSERRYLTRRAHAIHPFSDFESVAGLRLFSTWDIDASRKTLSSYEGIQQRRIIRQERQQTCLLGI